MRIGIVSDLHRRLPAFVEEAFEGCDHIICAGDTEDERLLWHLQTIALVTNVRGNNDWSIDAPFAVTTTLAGTTFFVVHRPEDIGIPDENVDVIVHGHTHTPRDETINGVRYLNPGSPTYPRRSNPSCLVIEAENGTIGSLRFVEGTR
ncbi:MAG: metallophosphoesterase family protein [Eggerthellaceae bacterium]|nr:metallophosphoesterase family protein [Eggerthellaceae bacterium]